MSNSWETVGGKKKPAEPAKGKTKATDQALAANDKDSKKGELSFTTWSAVHLFEVPGTERRRERVPRSGTVRDWLFVFWGDLAMRMSQQRSRNFASPNLIAAVGSNSFFAALPEDGDVPGSVTVQHDAVAVVPQAAAAVIKNTKGKGPVVSRRVVVPEKVDARKPLEDLFFIDARTGTRFLYDARVANSSRSEAILETVAKFLDGEIAEKGISGYAFAHKSFSLVKESGTGWWEMPYRFFPYALKGSTSDIINSLSRESLQNGAYGLIKSLVEGQKKAITISPLCATTYGTQVVIQAIGVAHPDLLFVPFKDGRSVLELIFHDYRNTFATTPAVGHTLLWVLGSQTVFINHSKKFVNPKGLELWIKYYYPLLAGEPVAGVGKKGEAASPVQNIAASVLHASLEFLQLVIDG
ncbi:hypothetical protein BDK51DRAFT_50783 [Blyttiomyces helicus]|uniref:Uncharacterized protein n=1 Tax=Blyttiomyces helicus TaxID=388810 RepID=A0A4P9W2N0_9FUNG|nr:hypothetical protein BDK51DRAFT_50783 [Blyttiomyces helicus]|eukprot:RKO85635.1 hypothetical protein BDK51DRAFT_50783 [Blyttiomyces helicus]